jgi:hypothetical protein
VEAREEEGLVIAGEEIWWKLGRRRAGDSLGGGDLVEAGEEVGPVKVGEEEGLVMTAEEGRV